MTVMFSIKCEKYKFGTKCLLWVQPMQAGTLNNQVPM